jgi:hypothetical protein
MVTDYLLLYLRALTLELYGLTVSTLFLIKEAAMDAGLLEPHQPLQIEFALPRMVLSIQ